MRLRLSLKIIINGFSMSSSRHFIRITWEKVRNKVYKERHKVVIKAIVVEKHRFINDSDHFLFAIPSLELNFFWIPFEDKRFFDSLHQLKITNALRINVIDCTKHVESHKKCNAIFYRRTRS